MDKGYETLKTEVQELYKKACAWDPGHLLRLARESEDRDELRFYVYISDMNMQRVQKEVIRQNLF